MDILSVVTGAFRLAVDAPVLVVGIIIGMVVYNYLLKKNPTLLAKLIAAAANDMQAIITKVNSTATTASALQAAVTAMTPQAALPSDPALAPVAAAPAPAPAPVVAIPAVDPTPPAAQPAPVVAQPVPAPAPVAAAPAPQPAPAPAAQPAAPAAQ